MQTKASLLKTVRITSNPDIDSKEVVMVSTYSSEQTLLHSRTMKPSSTGVDLIA